jgi:O-antigen ligase
MLAASFTGFCAAMMAMGAMAIAGRMYPSPKLLLLAALLVAGLFASGYQMPDIFAKRVAPALQEGSLDSAGTYDDRADLIVEAWKHAEHTAVIGMGVDEYRKFSSFGQPVHNMYMLELAEGGILALAGWLGIVGMLILIPLTKLGRHRIEASLCLAVIMVFLIFTIASPHMYARLWMVPVLLSLGIVVTAGDPLPLLSGRIPRNRPQGTGQMY